MQHLVRKSSAFFLFAAVAFLAGCHKTTSLPGMGDEWRSMTQGEKQKFVSGYLDGSSNASFELCYALERRVPIPPIKEVVDPAETTCRHFRPQYTHVDQTSIGSFAYVDPYVRVLDDFYKHPDCRVMPFTSLLEHLNDAEYRSGEELYKFVRGGADGQSAFHSWGSFSIEGIDKCYGADRAR